MTLCFVSFSSHTKRTHTLTLLPYRLGALYNAVPGQNRKDLVKEWACSLYPELWGELVARVPKAEQKEGHSLFQLPRGELTA